MLGNSNYIDLSGPADSISVSSVVNPECSFVGMSSQLGVCWIPSIIFFFVIVIFCLMCSQIFLNLLFLDVVFDTFELNVIFDMITGYI